MSLQRSKREGRTQVDLFGCGFESTGGIIDETVSKALNVRLNVQAPWVPIVTDGKAPDLLPLDSLIVAAMRKGIRTAKRKTSIRGQRKSQKDFIIENLDEAVAITSGNGAVRFSLRQLFYTVRPWLISEFGDAKWGTFCRVITLIEQGGNIPDLYRDSRGVLYHPHLQTEVPLGTLSIENYSRPEWTFKRILYAEKEGPLHSLRSVGWPEIHDCALLSSKGYAGRAAKDILDFLSDTDEDLEFFCISDADGEGSMIYESLCQATAARPGRKVEIINLGLDPEQAIEMGLPIEPRQSKKRVPVGRHMAKWEKWFQKNRIELNAMPAPQFVAWLTMQLGKHTTGKLIPPPEVAHDRLVQETRARVREKLLDNLIREHRLDEMVEAEMEQIAATVEVASESVRTVLKRNPKKAWWEPLKDLASKLAGVKARRGKG